MHNVGPLLVAGAAVAAVVAAPFALRRLQRPRPEPRRMPLTPRETRPSAGHQPYPGGAVTIGRDRQGDEQ